MDRAYVCMKISETPPPPRGTNVRKDSCIILSRLQTSIATLLCDESAQRLLYFLSNFRYGTREETRKEEDAD